MTTSIKRMYVWSCKDGHEHSTEWEAQQCILLHDAIQLLKETDGVDPWLPEEFLYWHGTRLEITQKWDAAQHGAQADPLPAVDDGNNSNSAG